MSSKGKAPMVPKLRFPGFGNPWVNCSLAEVLSEHKLRNSANRDVFSVSMERGVINQVDHLGRSFAAADTSHYNVGRRFDLVYTKSPLKEFPFGIVKQCKFDGEVALSPLYGVFTPINPSLGLLIEAYFESPYRAQMFLAPLCQKGAKNTIQIANATFLAGRLHLPAEFTEQQKVADCLSSLDELIGAQARKLEALEIHKKGLLQRLFPRKGEVLPRLRFAEFKNEGNWSERKLGSLFSNRIEKGEQGLPIYSVTMNDGMVRRDSLERKVDDIEDAAGNKKVLRSDIAYNMMRMWQGAMGVAPEDCLVSPAYVVLAPEKDAVPLFFHYLFKLPAMLEILTAHSRGLTKDRLRLYFDDFARIAFPCPKPKEQKRIADFLRSLDDQITANSKELEALKSHKKALMQQLFPSVEVPEA